MIRILTKVVAAFNNHVVVNLFVQRLKTRDFGHYHISQVTEFLIFIHRVHLHALPVLCEDLLMLTRMRSCQRGTTLGVVLYFVSGQDLGICAAWIGFTYGHVVVLVIGSLLMKELLFRKVGAKVRIHNSRGVVFDRLHVWNLRHIRVWSWNWWHDYGLFIATVWVPIEVIRTAGNDSTRSVIKLPLAEQSSLLLSGRLFGSLFPTWVSLFLIFENSLKLVPRMIRREVLESLSLLKMSLLTEAILHTTINTLMILACVGARSVYTTTYSNALHPGSQVADLLGYLLKRWRISNNYLI